ncbi:hypothetical protein HYFRA_00005080 [Hymenoscyphus fraxineus]|uniref:Carrier domain-containing protein n=1 Tax=Hymenoscyphus fraxineus TaxID=746836 RepID=A0A9N9LCM7_9HELO|nr:hypothetical protein HYFRA_00005080 [Hymenoscyphus fraxineus]
MLTTANNNKQCYESPGSGTGSTRDNTPSIQASPTKIVGELSADEHDQRPSAHQNLESEYPLAMSRNFGLFPSSPESPESERPGTFEQSFAQRNMWSWVKLHSTLAWYLLPYTIRFRGPLQLDALNRAILTLERRHETLRTTFTSVKGVKVQTVHPFKAKKLEVIDISSSGEFHLDRVLHLERTIPFNLETEPGWRVSIFRCANQDHILSITMHRMISDTSSLHILHRDLATFYSAAIRGQDPLLVMQPLPIQYCNYALLQKERSQLEYKRQIEHLEMQLEGSRPAELLCDKPRQTILSGQAAIEHLSIESTVSEHLQRFCETEQVTQFAALLTAFRTAHYRLTGMSDAIIGTINTNREQEGTKDMIGLFTTTSCFRIKIDGGESFQEVVRQVHAITAEIEASTNQQVPLELLAELQNESDMVPHLPAQILFAVHSERDQDDISFEGVQMERLALPITSAFDLELHFYHKGNVLRGETVFSKDLFEHETIKKMLGVFHEVLERGLAEPGTAVSSLGLWASEDYTTLDRMGLLHIQTTDYPRDASVVEIFRRQAMATPDRVAVKDSSTQLSYAQLNQQSEVIAMWLARLSLAPETLVGVLAPRSCQTIVAFIGILKANLAYLPFDTTTPSGRMATILSSIECRKIILVGSDVRIPTTHEDVEFVSITDVLNDHDQVPGNFRQIEASANPSPTSLAYVMFTSGSTGRPKGVMVEHRGIVRLVKGSNMADYLPECATMAHLTSIAFDNSTWEIYAPLLNGGTLICIDATTVLDSRLLGRVFAQDGVQSAMLTPTLLKEHLIENPNTIAALDMLCVQGERANIEDMQMALKLTGGTVINAYGPTENSVTSTFFVFSALECCNNGVPIGRALSNSGAYVMDKNQQLVPLGVIGELVVTGDGLARGYMDPQANEDRFISILIQGDLVKAYRTGDYVRYRPADGQLEFFGRIDGQVKVRGNRVELGEIEHVLHSHDCVADAVAIIQNDGQDARLTSYVTIRDIRPGSVEESHLVETWLDHWDVETYTPVNKVRLDEIGRDFIGWTSTYTGSDIDRTEMNEWLGETIDTILDGGAAGNVLEIGTGSGMILFNLIEGLKSYVGLEPSERAVDFVTKAVKSVPTLADKVFIHRATAGDVGQLEISVLPDIAILNSVIQYFPSQDYLLRVLQSLINLGIRTLFIGDIRSYALQGEFLASRALFISAKSNVSKDEFRRIMTEMEKAESELLLDPAFFTSLSSRLPSISHVEILPKRIHATNELSCYRYAAVVHIDRQSQRQHEPIHEISQDHWIDFMAENLDRQSLCERLQASSASSVVAICNIPNGKTILEKTILDSLDNDDEGKDLQSSTHWIDSSHQKSQHCPSLAPVDIVSLAHQTSWKVELSWARQHSQRGGLDAIFHRYETTTSGNSRVKFRFPTDDEGRPYKSLSSQPLRRQLKQKVRDQLHKVLRDKLPYYMVPQVITFLDRMPVNQNGKIDRPALAASSQSQRPKRGQIQQPMSFEEVTMQRIWSEVLNIDKAVIGRHDSFFNLGGDSIAAMRLVTEARKVGIKMAVADIFRHPILHDLTSQSGHVVDISPNEIGPFALLGDEFKNASFLEDISSHYHLDLATIQDIYPCTPLQEGLMFLSSKRPGDYMRQAVIELSGVMSEKKLRRAWEAVVRALAILRTRIIQQDRLGLLQVVLDETVSWIDSSASGLEAYLIADKKQSMDLGQPLSRYALVKDETGLPKWFVWTTHHALYDGWSLHLILENVYRAYQEESIKIEPGRQFQAFIKYIKDQDDQETTTYWQKVLADCKCVIFPSLPPSMEQPMADTIIKHYLPPPQSLYGGITTSILIRAAWALVMGRMTNSDDVVFGVTIYGRNAPVPGLDKMTAPTIATVPVRVQTDKKQTCSEYLQAVQQDATEMIPFEQTGLQRIAQTCSAGQQACKFQTQLVIQPQATSSTPCPFGKWQEGSEEKGFTTYAFTLELCLSQNEITAIAMFDSRAIEPWLVRKMLQRFEWVMHQLSQAAPGMALSEIEMSVPEDLELIWKWNGSVPAQIEKCVHDMIKVNAQTDPNAAAVFAWDGELTYGHLDELASTLADELIDLGVAPDVLVPLCFEKSIWTVVAILSVLKAGGGFVLLDPSLPEQRLRGIVQQVKGNLILSSASNEHLASQLAPRTITLSWHLFAVLADRASPHIQREPPSPSSILYVIFTSGSTGMPKGVVITHSNMASALEHQVKLLGLTKESRLLDFASYSFDVSISNIFTVLAAGGCLCIPSEEDRRDNLEQSIVSLSVNALDLTPSVAQLLSPARLPGVRSLTLGGEPLRLADIEQWWGKVQVRNAYGPSECTPTSTINHEASSLADATHIGKGAGLVTWVVDPENHNELLPPGCTGELLLEGPLVGHGYLENPDKTAASFIEEPIWLQQGSPSRPGRHGRLYKTGDLVRYNEDGNLTFVCRKDEQVKIRGQRVELGEIEHVLRSQDYVDDAVAIVQHNDRQEAWIASFVTVRDLDAIQEKQPCDGEEAQQQVKLWENQFDGDTYVSIESVQPSTIGRDFVGWTSMYDGSEIDTGEMNEWLNDTIQTILRSCGPASDVLEIGTGSGMILFNLADELQSYVGLEPSQRAVDFTAKAAKSIPTLSEKVKLFRGTAADIPRLALDTPLIPNVVVLNSVIQYFPSQEYLLRVIKDLIELGSVKTIFFGDVRSYALHKEFLALRALHINGNANKDEIRRIIANLEKTEPELLVDPRFFTSLPSRLSDHVEHVEILPKIMNASNELSCYRYAAVVHIRSRHLQQHTQQVGEISQESWINFTKQGLSKQSLLDHLNCTSMSAVIAISNIPYSKNIFARDLIDSLENQASETPSQSDWLSALRENAQHCHSLSAIDLVHLAQQAGYRVEISWARQHSQRGGLDAIFYRNNGESRIMFRFPADHQDRAYHMLCSQPLRNHMETKIRTNLGKKLQAQLPSYMLPQMIQIVDRMPVSKSGKIDRRMLAESIKTQTTGRATKHRQPSTAMEKEMQRIWSSVLKIESNSIGVDDGFIQLGGNSLDAMKVVTLARRAGINIAVADMFRHSTTSIARLLQPQSSDQLNGNAPISADLMAEIARYDARIASVQVGDAASSHGVDDHPQAHPPELLTVLLTGANGFIGTQILRQLLEHSRVGRVVAIVRGESAAKATQRTIDAARKAQWWTVFHQKMLEVWPGDLSAPHMGLDPTKWRLIEEGKTVDIIIHNGASVHFMKSYAALEAANVNSTAEMLRIVASNARMKFVYVSSARHQEPTEEQEGDVAREIAINSNGYSQTKFVAEALVRRAAQRSPHGRNQFAVVSPGLVIGTPTEGVANADDWIWRLAAACIRVGAYNADTSDKWIPISDAAATATTIIDTALDRSSKTMTQVRGGMTLGDFWATLTSTGYQLEARGALECTAAIRQDIQDSQEKHPLWALTDMLESLEETEKSKWATSWRENGVSLVRLKVALRKSAEFLSKVGFFPLPRTTTAAEVQPLAMSAFFRSGI